MPTYLVQSQPGLHETLPRENYSFFLALISLGGVISFTITVHIHYVHTCEHAGCMQVEAGGPLSQLSSSALKWVTRLTQVSFTAEPFHCPVVFWFETNLHTATQAGLELTILLPQGLGVLGWQLLTTSGGLFKCLSSLKRLIKNRLGGGENAWACVLSCVCVCARMRVNQRSTLGIFFNFSSP